VTVGLHPPDIYVGETGTAKGRGVFANAPIKHHDLVEVAPVIVFRVHALPRIVATILFNWEELAKEEPNTRAIAFGYGSLYNHANPANLRYEADVRARAVKFIAVRDIAPREELTINYNARGGGPTWPNDHWFESYGITRLEDSPLFACQKSR
jgi:uncharacterized protein